MLFIPGFLKKSGKRKKTKSPSSASSSGRFMMALEPRYLYDAAGLIAGLEVFDPPDLDGADLSGFDIPDGMPIDPVPPAALSPTEIVFVDPSVQHPDKLTEGISENVLVIRLDADEDGVAQIGAILGSYDNIQAVHILTHGSSGSLQLGSAVLSSDTIDAQAEALRAWGEGLSVGADILIYGCNVASGASGQAFVAELADLTGADVAASSDLTGSEAMGGNWDLEYASGNIETGIGISSEAQGMYAGLLANFTVMNADDSGTGSLREALMNAADGDTISFNAALDGQTIILNSSLQFYSNATIDNDGITGPDDGTPDVNITISGYNPVTYSSCTVLINPGYTAGIDGLVIRDGDGPNGGGIYNSGDLTIEDSTITDNFANRGGGIFNYYGDVHISNSTISSNYAKYGGGIFNYGGYLLVDNGSHVDDNTAGYGNGGGIYNEGDLTIDSSYVNENYAYWWGGGVLNNGDARIYSSHIDHNVAAAGGGIENWSDLYVYDSYINYNAAYYQAGGDGGGGYGGGIDNWEGYAWLNNTHVDYNYAEYNGGGIFNYDYNLYIDNYSHVDYNTAAHGSGGGIYNYYGNLYIDNGSHVDYNTAGSYSYGKYSNGSGGGIFNYYGNVYIDNGSHVDHNTAIGFYYDGDYHAGNGGGIYNYGGYVLVDNGSYVSDNTVYYGNGGGIYNNKYGGLYVEDSAVTGNVFYGKYSYGGGIFNAGGLYIQGSNISDNYAKYGGGIFNSGGIYMQDSTVSGNYAALGGGMYNTGYAQVQDSAVSENVAILGGGVCNVFGGNMGLLNTTINDNDGMVYGGGIFNAMGAYSLIENSAISGNTAKYDGGGILNAMGAYSLIENSAISGNTAKYGGGIANLNAYAIIQNSTISNNTADYGGGLLNTGAAYVYHSTITGNTYDAILNDGGLYMGHTIVDGDFAGGDYFYSQGFNLFTQAAVPGADPTDLVGANAGLGPLADNGGPTYTHALLDASDALDAGDPAFDPSLSGLYFDQRGLARVYGGRIDIGAVEMQEVAPPPPPPPPPPENIPPYTRDDVFHTDAAVVLTVEAEGVLENDFDLDPNDVLSVDPADSVSAMGALVSINADGSFTYDPTGVAAFQTLPSDETLPDTFTYTISDGNGGTNTATVTVIVRGAGPANQPPVAVDDTGKAESMITVRARDGLLVNDSDPDGDPITVVGFDWTSALGASVAVNRQGGYTYDPTSVLEGMAPGETLEDTFTYTISDGRGGCDTATVTILLTAPEDPNQPPVAVDDVLVLDAATSDPVQVNVLGNDSDPDGDPISVTSFDKTSALGASVTIHPDGSYTYMPGSVFEGMTPGQTRADTFTYTISDGNGGTDTATVTISFTQPNPDIPDDGGDQPPPPRPSGWNLGNLFRGFGRLGSGGFFSTFGYSNSGGNRDGSGFQNNGPTAKSGISLDGDDNGGDASPPVRTAWMERLLDRFSHRENVREMLNQTHPLHAATLDGFPDDGHPHKHGDSPMSGPDFPRQVERAAGRFNRDRDAFLEQMGIVP